MCGDLENLAIPRAQITPRSKFNAKTQTPEEQRGTNGALPTMYVNHIIIKMRSQSNISIKNHYSIYFNITSQLGQSYTLKTLFASAQISPPHTYPPPQTSYSGKRRHRLRDAGNPKRNVLTAGSYPQPGKSLIYNPTWETTGKQQEVIFKELVATGSKCRGSKHVPIKVRQLQKNQRYSSPQSSARMGGGRGLCGRGQEEGERKTLTGSSCQVG